MLISINLMKFFINKFFFLALVELFHIINDPLEEHNLAAEHPEIVADLQLRLDNWGYRPDQGIPWLDVIFDPDTFGGEENRAPWVESIKE